MKSLHEIVFMVLMFVGGAIAGILLTNNIGDVSDAVRMEYCQRGFIAAVSFVHEHGESQNWTIVAPDEMTAKWSEVWPPYDEVEQTLGPTIEATCATLIAPPTPVPTVTVGP